MEMVLLILTNLKNTIILSKDLINYISEILQEKKKDILYQLYAIMKKEFMIKTLEKTLKIMNSGGMNKIKDVQNKRSIKNMTIATQSKDKNNFIWL